MLKALRGDCRWSAWAPSGHVSVRRGHMVACTASPCDAARARKTTSATARCALASASGGIVHGGLLEFDSDEAVLLCVRRALDAALGASSRRLHAWGRAESASGDGGGRGRCPCRKLEACAFFLSAPRGRAIVSSGTCFGLAASAWAAAHGIQCRALGPVSGAHRRGIWTHGA